MRGLSPSSSLPVSARNRPNDDWLESSNLTLLDVLRSKSQAWKLKKVAEAELVVLESRQRLATARLHVELAEMQVTIHQERVLSEHNLTLTRLSVEQERLRQDPALPPAPPLPVPEVQVDLSDRQIESLAIRAVTRLGQLRGAEAEQAWSAWSQELRRRFPDNLAAEIVQRATALRELAQQ